MLLVVGCETRLARLRLGKEIFVAFVAIDNRHTFDHFETDSGYEGGHR